MISLFCFLWLKLNQINQKDFHLLLGNLLNYNMISGDYHKQYELILEQIPADVCQNPSCYEGLLSSSTTKQNELIRKTIESAIESFGKVKKAPLESKTCPLCINETLVKNETGSYTQHRQGFYHLKFKTIPLKVHCTTCGYQELDQTIIDKVADLTKKMDHLVMELLALI